MATIAFVFNMSEMDRRLKMPSSIKELIKNGYLRKIL